MKLLVLIFVYLMALSLCEASLSLKDVRERETLLGVSGVIGSRLYIAAEGSAPWQVSVQNQHGDHLCGGAIIGDNVVLTAASCVSALDEGNLRVLTGTNKWWESAPIYDVEDIIMHSSYDNPLYHNDVALVKLATPIAYNDRTQNITLADLDELEEDETLTMTGWGSLASDKPLLKVLKKSKFKYISNEDCIEALGPQGVDVDYGNLCALSERSSGACYGDAGAPLVDSEGRLVGIASWAISCGEGMPVVFARVPFYSDWIRSSLKGCSLY